MVVLVILLAGIIIGLKFFPIKWKKLNERIQIISTLLLIFIMGVTLGSRPNFLHEFVSLGFQSIILAVLPILCSIILVYMLSKLILLKKQQVK